MCPVSNFVSRDKMAAEAAQASMLETWESCTLWDDRIPILWAFNSEEPQRIKKAHKQKKKERKNPARLLSSAASTTNPCEMTQQEYHPN